MSFDWYPQYPIDWKRDTLNLSLAEEGAYRRLNDEYMMNGGPLPDSDAALARLIGVSLEDWLAVAPTVRRFYRAGNGKLTHKRCEEELHAQALQAQCTSMKNRKAANKRWEQHRKIKSLQIHENDAPALQPQSVGNASRMPNDATLHLSKNINSSSSFGAARENPKPLPAAAAKRPSEVSRAELDEMIRRKHEQGPRPPHAPKP